MTQQESAITIKLEGACDISRAAELRDRLCAALDEGASLRVEASELERADTAGLQVLVAFAHEARQRDVGLEWLDPSEALLEAADGLGLRAKLGLHAAADSSGAPIDSREGD